ncbi:epimerase [Shewanella hanedai]|uniref:NAD-dependent epimerase/dehydratase family protein n=1 Tax=Shewanella hanedai TaxID=25 RepID=A0A553JTB1_SHEHA|nr:NAD-dependent epimerase/dehydratase family protein [Shewanella hanedai]TRY15696.1 NAD-dependent epimerase/dehydratase family protein [Shewanella hanedai]GGI71291.1 epimerase [Shewanella hanedai]
MKILLSGADGFIGQCLLEQDQNSLIHRCITRRNKLNEYDSFFVDNIDKHTIWDGAFDNIDTVIHLAGIAHNKSCDKAVIFNTNTHGTIRFAQEAAKAGVKRFVFVSTATIGAQISFNQEEASSQTRSKYDAEFELNQLADKVGLEVVIVRPTLVYGLNAPGNFGSLTKLVKKMPFLPFELTNNKRDFIAVQNLTDLLLTCAKHPDAAGHTFLASDGQSVSIKTFTNAIAKGLNKSLIQIPIPVSLMRLGSKLVGKSAMAEQLLGNLQVDSSNAHDVLGWSPPYSMEQAMASLSEKIK